MSHRPFSELEAKMSPESRERAKKKAEDMIRDITSCPSCALKDAEIERLGKDVSFYMTLATRAVVEGWRETEVQEEIHRRAYGEGK